MRGWGQMQHMRVGHDRVVVGQWMLHPLTGYPCVAAHAVVMTDHAPA
jgi:hypothetical protein